MRAFTVISGARDPTPICRRDERVAQDSAEFELGESGGVLCQGKPITVLVESVLPSEWAMEED